MVDQDVMVRVGQLLDRRVYTCRARRSNWSVSYSVRVKGAAAVAWMRALRPLLGKRRRAQVDRALASYAPRSNQRLFDSDAKEALDRLASGTSVREVADRFGVSIWCIYDLRLGRTHRHLERP